ncbi:hypothetical protein [Flavobacterium sp. 3-210]
MKINNGELFLISEAEQKVINEIEVKDTLICGSVTRVCDPEDMFDVVEQCKICGIWI